MPYLISFLKIHDFQLLVWKKYFFLEKFAPNYAELLKFTVMGAPTFRTEVQQKTLAKRFLSLNLHNPFIISPQKSSDVHSPLYQSTRDSPIRV